MNTFYETDSIKQWMNFTLMISAECKLYPIPYWLDCCISLTYYMLKKKKSKKKNEKKNEQKLNPYCKLLFI